MDTVPLCPYHENCPTIKTLDLLVRGLPISGVTEESNEAHGTKDYLQRYLCKREYEKCPTYIFLKK